MCARISLDFFERLPGAGGEVGGVKATVRCDAGHFFLKQFLRFDPKGKYVEAETNLPEHFSINAAT